MNKKPLPTIGVDKYTFFKVNEDSVSGTEYGEAYNLKGTVEIAPTDSGGSGFAAICHCRKVRSPMLCHRRVFRTSELWMACE